MTLREAKTIVRSYMLIDEKYDVQAVIPYIFKDRIVNVEAV